MRIVKLDAIGWKTSLDFLTALKVALNAPEWCGSSPDAINELMVWGLDGEVLAPPYIVEIANAAKAPVEVRDYITLIADCVQDAREEFNRRNIEDIDVGFDIRD
jgi:hypothetical protein